MLISVVTIHLEDFVGLERTLRSIERYLNDPRFEWVLVDGASKCRDEKQKLILSQALKSSSAGISERDAGIYDAMNKGTRLATGEYVLFLNAGDELHEQFSLDQLSALLKDSRPGMVWGQCVERYPNGKEITIKPRSPSWTWYCIPAYHPAIFFQRTLLGEAPYDTTFEIAADYDLVARLVTSGAEIQFFDLAISRFYLGGISDRRHSILMEEEQLIRSRHFNTFRAVSHGIVLLKRGLKQFGRVPFLRRLWRHA